MLIIKPSKNQSYFVDLKSQWSSPTKGVQIVELQNQLMNNDRVYWAGDAGDLITIISISDLIVTHCLSSCTAEALGARKKAVWYESGTKHSNVLYKNIPRLIVQGFSALNETLDYLLYQVTDDEYKTYLDTWIKENVEYSLDGLALTRLRKLLTN